MDRSKVKAFRLFLLSCCAAPLFGADVQLEALVKPTPSIMVSTGGGDCEATELWLRNKEKGSTEFLLRGRADRDITKTIADISAPVFSPDMKAIYFVSAAWATSGSIQKIDVGSKQVRFVIDGNSVAVITAGPHKGQLLVDRALIKYDKNGESLGRDSYLWLVSADGIPIFEIGLSEDRAAQEFRKLHSARSGETEPSQAPRTD